ncbi:hypothetical protein FT663_02451 [Candidozyma haemuli var. vulneris]|uniref:Uncharacterized protein n=1 Tax=Candidozyma haemuli TaxID=45357 RepID=A0A2V1ARA6_9ASCO|nr:hypothetical protein CXQ85_002395 [[Candida] haemuloni]KAF3989881.1 hypothetical protein FT662_02559 [[Candida] haemuloni var. vulneris]KAF3992007.1 hypothetical protein FT663_02451 [[Candida] haemuloni var. vulneris]PVH20600.1 hypothetical protein CXQ85_002395 [[Candida] haemuloni]
MARHLTRYGLAVFFVVLLVCHLTLNPKLPWTNVTHKLRPVKTRLVFGSSFPIDVSAIPDFINDTPPLRENPNYNYEHIEKHRPESIPVKKEVFHPHPFQVYDTAQDIGMDLHQCGLLRNNVSTEVSEATNLHTPLCDIVARVIRGIDRGDDEYLSEMAPYFDLQIRLQLKHQVCHRHWFRLAGSSLYLDQYGYHIMISRLAYSPDGNRRDPKFSFAYAQLYDENWQEVRDVSLVIPTNEQGAEFYVDEQAFRVAHYPQIIPVPFFHKYKDRALRYLGPEDPRLILVKNKNNYEEPMMIFNLHHQKYAFADDDEDRMLLKKPTTYRSMWISYPWQFQKGKNNVDDLVNTPTHNTTYAKAVELRIKNMPRQSKQKNWTPMISDADREVNGYDKTILFVYRWASMQVLKCDLETGKCGFLYEQNENLKVSSSIGPFRGGTQMANVRHVLQAQKQNSEELQKIIPPGREIWLGFARAHLVRCGCGNDLYRPNLVVVLKDTIIVNGEPQEVFKMSHVSSFVSLNIEIVPWDPSKPYKLCSGTNALIPNGISHWKVFSPSNSKAINIRSFMDELVLAVSVSDTTVYKVNIRGLLKALVTDDALFLPSGASETEIDKSKLQVPTELQLKAGTMPSFNNDNLVCAMLASVKFCSDYGKEKLAIEKDHILDTIFLTDTEEEDTKMDNYHDNLDELGIDPI